MSSPCSDIGAIPVATPVGWTVLTRMLDAASSLARARLMPTIPCFDAVYGVVSGLPLMPAAELMLTRLPPPRASRWGMAATQVFQAPIRLTSRTVRQSSGSWCPRCRR
ncbi:hypothetical protein GCM10020369_11120 [Cryptosporangium minutisporangium]|uniref:Transposase IS701-like DDE domain-containing protein n=1 Tax=Cryptosporangium minutisporangium TaxID=113569 RepID=A0ABP6SSD2_9ACTN